MRVEHGTVEAERADRPLDFGDAARYVARVECGECGKTVGVAAAGVGGNVVRLARQRRALTGAHHLHPRCGQQQQLPVDAIFVHVRQAQVTQILQHRLKPGH